MPFTPTHVAAALPALPWLRGRHVPASALVIGSMIPDAGVFLPRYVDYGRTHSVGGLFTLCLPLGLAAFLMWEYFLKAPLVDLAPRWVRRRTTGGRGPRRAPLTVRTLLWAVGLTLAGAATHVFWDSFTHPGRWGVRAVPALNRVVLTLPDWAPVREHAVPGYRVAQYGCTFVLLPVVILYAAVRLRRAEPTGDGRSAVPPWGRAAAWGLLLLLPTAAAARDAVHTFPRAPLRVTAVRAVIAFGLTLLVVAVALAAVHAAVARRPRG